MTVCASCGTENPERAKFCLECGASLAPGAATVREERKVVTCLFCDLVGFTVRAERLDPEEVRAVLQPYHVRVRAELERHGGSVEKFIGDAVMAVFGAPVAHDDDPERAVRAALAIRDAIGEEGELQVRIGVTTGEALVSVAARPEAGEGMAAGDVVNTAARLQVAAPVGGVLVDETTHRATGAVIEYEPHVPVAAKGKAGRVEAWLAREARARFGVDVRQHGAAPLVGRGRELEALVGALERARREESCQLVTLVGVPGIGKSRLVFELFGRVEEDEELIFWRQGRCLPYGEGASQWALGEMVKAQAGILESDPAARVAEKLARAARDLVGGEDPGWVEGHLRPLLGLGRAGAREEQREEAFAAWRRFFEALAEQRPTVLVFEDLHWADEGLLDFVDHLVEWATTVPLLVLCTARPELLERRPGWAGGKLNALLLSLSPLADEDSGRLVAALLDRTLLPAATQRELVERAGGNPLYAEQFTRLYRERGSADDLPLPESVQGIIAARLDGLPAEEKELLQDAAVLGKVFWAGALGRDGDAAGRLLHALERKESVRRGRRSSVEGEEEYAFRHGLIRDVAYGQIPRAPRAEKHRRAAEWIEGLGRPEDHAELLAHHYLAAYELARAAGQDVSELVAPALRALRGAGRKALALNSYEPAVAFLGQALELGAPDDPERPHTLFDHARALFHAREEGEAEFEESAAALEAAGDVELAAVAHVFLAELAWKATERDRCSRHLDQASTLVAGREPSRSKVVVLGGVSRYRMLGGEDEEALRLAGEALAMAEELGLDDLRAHALINAGPARFHLGDPAGGREDLERGIAIAEAANSSESLRGYVNLAAILGQAGDIRAAAEIYDRGYELARRLGHGPSVRWFAAERGWAAHHLGDWERTLELAAEFQAAGEAGPHHYLEPLLLGQRGAIRLARGDVPGALHDFDKALALARRAQDPQALAVALAESAYPLYVAGRARGAEAHLMEALDLDPFYATGGVDTAWVAGEVGRVQEFIEAIESLAVQSRWIDAALCAARGDYAAAADLCGEAGSLPAEAFARLRAAEALAAEGRLAEADEQLRRALAFWRSVGATRYVREGEALLARSA